MRDTRLPAAAAVLAAALIGTAANATEDIGACPSDAITSLEITYDNTGRPLVPVSVGGRYEKLLVDTAGYYGMITWGAVTRLDLHRVPVQSHLYYLLNGDSMSYMAIAHDVRVGDISVDDYPFLVMPPDWSTPGVAGTLAPNTLSHYDVEFDFGASRINLYQPTHCDGHTVYWTNGARVSLPLRLDAANNMHVTATIDGTEMDAVIDTGSATSILRSDEAAAVMGHTLDDSELVHAGTGHDNGWDSYRHHFQTLRIGGLTVRDPDILIMTDKLSQVREPDEVDKGFRIVGMQAPPLIIGMSALRQLHLYVAYKDEMLYATAASAH